MKRYLVIATAMLVSSSVFAEPHPGMGGRRSSSSTAAEAEPKIELTYNVRNDYVEADFKIEKAHHWAGMQQTYPGAELFKRLKGLPGIENIQFIPGKHTAKEKHYDKEVIASQRESVLMVRVKGSSPFSMMFKVEEEIHRCLDNALPDKPDEDDLAGWNAPVWGLETIGKEAPCKRFAGLTVTGPMAVYGTIPGAFGSHLQLLNQVKFEWEIRSSYNKENTELNSKFSILRQDFPGALNKILSWTLGGNIPFQEVFLENPQRNALLQIGRVLKTKNFEILRGE